MGLPVSGGSEGGSVGDRPLLWPTAEAAEQNAAHLMAFAAHHPPPYPPVSTFDLYTALKVSKGILQTSVTKGAVTMACARAEVKLCTALTVEQGTEG